MNEVILHIDIGKSILKHYFDQFNNIIFILTDQLELYFISPRIFSRKNIDKNSYSVIGNINLKEKYHILLSEISNTNSDNIQFDILRKDLMIKFNSFIVFISLDDFISSDYGEFTNLDFNSIKSDLYDINLYNRSSIESTKNMIQIKAFSNNYVFFHVVTKNGKHKILFYQLHLPNSSFIGGDTGFNFNFKIPVIFIALIILVIYHFFSKKKENEDDNDERAVRDELINELKKHGAFNEKTNKFKDKFKDEKNDQVPKDNKRSIEHIEELDMEYEDDDLD